MTSSSSQGPILLPERLYSSSSSSSKTQSPITIRHVSSSPILHSFIDDGIKKKSTWNDVPKRKDQCLCSPATNAKAFKCSMHRIGNSNSNVKSGDDKTVSLYHRLYVRRKALVNSLKKLGTTSEAESGLMRRGLASLVKPSARQLRRRDNEFRPCRPSRLSVMSKVEKEE